MAEYERTIDFKEGFSLKGITAKKFILSLQHFIAMFGATILVPLLTGFDPLVTLFAAGIGTLLFHYLTGFIVPVFLGSSFAFIAPVLMIKEATGDLAYASGAIMISGLTYLVFSVTVKLIGYKVLKKLFPTVITGTMIIIIGLTLAPVAIQWASSNWLIALSTLLTVIIFSNFFKGFLSMIPVLIGVLVGYSVASFRSCKQ
jgi:uracil permease